MAYLNVDIAVEGTELAYHSNALNHRTYSTVSHLMTIFSIYFYFIGRSHFRVSASPLLHELIYDITNRVSKTL